ncbi:hypothetical protein TrRE_jg11152 [Triparma retinervis]|uniref:ABC transporter domain-containing protein n=1 Tax=Triparma retinervis TaxID=2557542 RepID=A0A9W7CHK9_9STRA|nr:hypothetical protein TrRE_jg11152 [Triparma retinervis]
MAEVCDFCSRTTCLEGQYCPGHYAVALNCPSGYYCPTLTTRVPCPSSYYCREASVTPSRCGIFSSCPEMSSYPIDLSLAVILIFIVVGWLVLNSLLFSIRDTGRMIREKKRRTRHKEIEITMQRPEVRRMGSKIKLNAQGPQVAMLRKSRNLNLGFRELTVDIVDGKSTKRIIDNVSGDIRAGRLTAVMGPSGAGKSSFLHVIGGRLRAVGRESKVNLSGSVLINGERRSMHSYRRVIGFVPQDDVLHENLSAKESFRLISGLRLPKHYTYKQRKELVNNVLLLLDLEKIRHERIGDTQERGISGGQRKRVNIGIELVADPWMLFLDEPTSGLDSASAQKVVSILRKLADLGLTVVCVLHQPRISIFDLLDDVILLGAGGRLVYSGPRRRAVAYFRTMGFEMGNRVTNPADWLTDVVAGEVKNNAHKDMHGSEDLQSLWYATRQARMQRISGTSSFTQDTENGIADEVETKLKKAGMSITKHPRWGAPEKRILYLKAEEGKMYLVWSSTKEHSALWGAVGNILSMGSETREDMDSILEIREGLTTKVLERTGVPEKSFLYLSIILRSRTLDLECESAEERDDLLLCLQHHLRRAKRQGVDGGTPGGGGRYARSALPPHTPTLEMMPKKSAGKKGDLETGGASQESLGSFTEESKNPVRRTDTRIGGARTLGSVTSREELSNLVDVLESVDSDDDSDDGKIGSRSWSADDDDRDYEEFSPRGRKASNFSATPRGRKKRSSSISPKQALKGAFKRGSTLGGNLKRRIARRFSAAPQKVENLLDPLSRMNPTFFVQFQAYLKISFLVQSASAVMIDLFLISLSGLALGIVYSNVEESGNEIYSFAMSTLSMGIMSSVERYFPSEKQVLIRETSSGTSVRAYFLGKNVAHFPFILVAPVFFAVFYVAFAAPRCSALDLYSGLLAIVWSCTGAGYLLSMTFNNKAQLACTVFPLIATMFAGVNPTLTNLKETSFVGYAVSTVSYARFATNFFWLKQAEKFDDRLFPNVETTTVDHGYDSLTGGECLACLWAIGLLLRVLAFFKIRSLKNSHVFKS